jgi:hypothetical protein
MVPRIKAEIAEKKKRIRVLRNPNTNRSRLLISVSMPDASHSRS